MKVLITVVAVSVMISAFAECVELQEHQGYLKSSFNTDYWKEFCSSEDWHIRCIFVDIDGDQKNELITCTALDEDRMGDYWTIWKCFSNGKMMRSLHKGDIRFNCDFRSFCKLENRSGGYKVIGLAMNAEKVCDLNGSKMPAPDCYFEFLIGNEYQLREMTPSFDSVFNDQEVRSVEHIYPEKYFGFDFKPPKNVPHSPHLLWPPYSQPKGDLRFGGGIGEPSRFDLFLENYRWMKKRKSAVENKGVCVYVVFLDADNDGVADFYITSDLDKLEDGDYVWELYMQQGGEFTMAKDVVRPVASRKELCGLKPVVKAAKMSFCRIVRLDVAPLFLIIDKNEENQVRNAIMDIFAHRVEKLPCQTYHDVQ